MVKKHIDFEVLFPKYVGNIQGMTGVMEDVPTAYRHGKT
jgi:hypothetical protein